MGLLIPTHLELNDRTDTGRVDPADLSSLLMGEFTALSAQDPATSLNVDESSDGGYVVEGLAMPWAEMYNHPAYGMYIRFAPDAFTENLAQIEAGNAVSYFAADDHGIGGLHLHGKSSIKTGEGSLRYWVTDEGLMVSAHLVGDAFGAAIYKRIALGILDKLSIAAWCDDYTEETIEDMNGAEQSIITFTSCRLRETSAVAYPAFKKTWLRIEEAGSRDGQRLPDGVAIPSSDVSSADTVDALREAVKVEVASILETLDEAQVLLSEMEADAGIEVSDEADVDTDAEVSDEVSDEVAVSDSDSMVGLNEREDVEAINSDPAPSWVTVLFSKEENDD